MTSWRWILARAPKPGAASTRISQTRKLKGAALIRRPRTHEQLERVMFPRTHLQRQCALELQAASSDRGLCMGREGPCDSRLERPQPGF